MPGVIPREGFDQRLAGLREQRTAIEARIAEVEHWLGILDKVEADAALRPDSETAATSATRGATKKARTPRGRS